MPDSLSKLDLRFEHLLLQPLDSAKKMEDTLEIIEYCKRQPQWRLSLQMHKILNIR
jgi:organic radical activating enzyme